jgi:hypothetical protein
MASRISVLALAAGLGLAGGAVLLETLPTASSGPSGRVRPERVRSSGPPPFTVEGNDARTATPAPATAAADRGEEAPPEDPEATPEAGTRRVPVLCGVVLDGDGRPVQRAVLEGPRRSRHCWPVQPQVEITGEDGSFRWEPEWVRHPARPEFTVKAKGYVPKELVLDQALFDIAERDGGLQGIEITLQPEAVLEGTVRGPDGTPFVGASVVLTGDPGPRIPMGTIEVTDGEGRFRFSGLDPDRQQWILAYWGEYILSDRADASVHLVAGETARIDLDLVESKEVPVVVRVIGIDVGWTFQVDREDHLGESALLLLKGRTGRYEFSLWDAGGERLVSGVGDVPRDATEWEITLDLSDRPPPAPRPVSHDIEDPPPPDAAE